MDNSYFECLIKKLNLLQIHNINLKNNLENKKKNKILINSVNDQQSFENSRK